MAGLALGTQSGQVLASGVVSDLGALQGHHAAAHQQPGQEEAQLEPGQDRQELAMDGQQRDSGTASDRGHQPEIGTQDLSARTRVGAEESEHGEIQTTGLQRKEIQEI